MGAAEVASRPRADVSVRALGGLTLHRDGEPVRVPPGKQRDLLAVLTIHAPKVVPVERLIDELWGEEPPATVTTALQVHVSTLRKSLGDRLRYTGGGYQLDLDGRSLDTARFDAAVRLARASDTQDDVRAALREALDTWGGTPYAGIELRAAQYERNRLEEARIAVAEELYGLELARGRHGDIADELGALVAIEPGRERLVAHLMLALYRCGRSADAGAAYQRLVAELAEVGAEPADTTAALARGIKLRDPTLDANPQAVPAPAGRFVGRRWELDHLATLLSRHRLLSLVGPGGSGKTRMALQLAREQAGAHPDGTFFVDLAEADAAPLVLVRVAASVGVRERPGEDLRDTVATALATGRALLLLDNCEQVVHEVRSLAAYLLARCTGTRLLVTSRLPLDVAGEVVWNVYGLAVPAVGAPAEAVAGADAVRLLAERGAAARPGFKVDATNLEVVAALCRRIDGLPLAIEMIVPRLRALSIQEIERRLVSRLDLAGQHPGSGRHATMRAAVDWSHALLATADQVLLRRLAVFAGGWTLDAAEVVAAGAPVSTEHVTDGLLRLVDQSMVVAAEGPHGTRYSMLETIQEFATERLADSDEDDDVHARHAAWAVQQAGAAADFGGDLHGAQLARLRTEYDNLRAALGWCIDADPARGLALAASLWWYWWLAGQLSEGRWWLRRMLDAAPAGAPARADGLRAAAALARSELDFDAAWKLGEQCLALHRGAGDQVGVAWALTELCHTANACGDFRVSLEYGQDALRRAHAARDPRSAAHAANALGITFRCLGQLDEAELTLSTAAERFAVLHDRRGAASALHNLAIIARRRGRFEESRELGLRSLSLYRDLELAEGQADALDGLAYLECAERRHAVAIRLLAVADRVRRDLGASAFTPDEIADRSAALAASTSALPAVELLEIETQALSASLDDVVSDLLAEH